MFATLLHLIDCLMKYQFVFSGLVALGSLLGGCGKDEAMDLEPPVFQEITRPRTQGGSGVVKIRGEYMEARSENSTHLHVRGTVTDNQSLSQMRIDIHKSHDGHTHARLETLRGYRVDEVVDLGGVKEYVFDKDLYYDDDDYAAGPYHVILHAVDMAGNSTSFSEGSSIVRSIYLKRPYMPLIAIDGDDSESATELQQVQGSTLAVPGFLQHRRAGKNFTASFIRVSVVDNTDRTQNTNWQGNVVYEGIWGTSQFLRDNAGAFLTGLPLPEFPNDRLRFSDLLATKPNTVGPQHFGKVLRIEVEDSGGNLAVREFVIRA